MACKLIFATSENNVLDLDGKIPWDCPGDLAHFYQTTKWHPVIMGRKTYESLPRPLKNRLVIVVSSDYKKYYTHRGVVGAKSLEGAIEIARQISVDYFIAGGSSIYQEAISKHYVDEIIRSTIRQDVSFEENRHVLFGPHFANHFKREGKLAVAPEFTVQHYKLDIPQDIFVKSRMVFYKNPAKQPGDDCFIDNDGALVHIGWTPTLMYEEEIPQ